MHVMKLALFGAMLTATTHAAVADGLVASMLPTSRAAIASSDSTKAVTVFATIINTSGKPLVSCGLDFSHFVAGLSAGYSYRLTNPATNQLTGGIADEPFSLSPGASQTMVIAIISLQTAAQVTIRPHFTCLDSPNGTTIYDALPIDGLDTIEYSASAQQPPDVVALSATTNADGIVHIQGQGAGAFAVAIDNVGTADTITATADTGSLPLPVQLSLCQTDARGQCLSAPSPSVSLPLAAGATATFGVFVQAQGELPFRPDTARVFVHFADSTKAIRGGTSVAVTNVPSLDQSKPMGGIFATQTPYYDPVAGSFKVSSGLLLMTETGLFEGLNDVGDATFGTRALGSDLSFTATSADYFAGTQGYIGAATTPAFSWQGAFSQSKWFYAQRKIVQAGGVNSSALNDSLQISGSYQAGEYERGSTLIFVGGVWNVRDGNENLLGSITVAADGTYKGTISGCSVNGLIATLNSRYNVYAMALNLPTCAVGGTTFNNFTGLASLVDALSTDDTLFFVNHATAGSYGGFQAFTRY